MEGHFILGVGDGTRRALFEAPLEVLAHAREEATRVLASDASASARIQRLFDLVDGFESTYELELLATVHLAAREVGFEGDEEPVRRFIASWSERKSRMFPPQHVHLALVRLELFGMLPPRAMAAKVA